MPESPAAQTPYEVLGVAADVSDDELRRAYRRALRETHPDVGGNPARFHAVQRAWERIGDPGARALYDRGSAAAKVAAAPHASASGRRRPERSGVRARSHGHPGGLARERYLAHMREWVGRGVTLDTPYDPALVRSAPRHIRRMLAEAIAEENTARVVSTLGLGYTIWNSVAVDDDTLDHVVLGPAGLFAIRSQDWGCALRVVRGELTGEELARGEAPFRELARVARRLARALRVRFTAVLIVVPDDALEEPIVFTGRKRDAAVVRLSMLPKVLRDGLGDERLSLDDVFDVRGRVQHGIRLR